jgi:hypothetical protein
MLMSTAMMICIRLVWKRKGARIVKTAQRRPSKCPRVQWCAQVPRCVLEGTRKWTGSVRDGPQRQS